MANNNPLITTTYTKNKKMIEPSIMADKFRIQAKIEETYFDSFATTPPKWFFFYDTLLDPAQLEKVLQLGNEDQETENTAPVTRPASIAGYSSTMHYSYPTLVEGPSAESVVRGVAFEVTRGDVAKKVAEHLGYTYVNQDCVMRFEDGESLLGMTFKFRGLF